MEAMTRGQHRSIGLSIAALLAVSIGVHAELLHARPIYEFTIDTGWGVVPGHERWLHSLNHEERLLAQLTGIGVLGAIAATRWRRAAVLPALTGAIVLFYPVRAVWHHAIDTGIYTGVPFLGDPSSRVILGAEPFLLVVGGLLLLGSGVLGWWGSDATFAMDNNRDKDSLNA
jgi:hypothetical protein